MKKAFVLLSGGIDSTTCLFKAIYDFGAPDTPDQISQRIKHNMEAEIAAGVDPIDWVEAVSVFYGQRHKKEMEYAKSTCDLLGIKHAILDVGNILSGKQVMLTDESKGLVEVPDISYGDIKGVSPTYVPFRNGTLLSAITAHAQKWVNEQINEMGSKVEHDDIVLDKDSATIAMQNSVGIYFGAHSEDAANWAYPDCTPEFIGSMANAIYIGTYQAVRLYTPIQWLMKDQVVELGDRMEVPWAHTWSCYKGEKLHCGVCPTCRSRREAFIKAGVYDPTQYAATAA